MPDVQVGMLEGGLDGDARGRIKREHVIKEIEGVRIGIREETWEHSFRHVRKIANVFLGSWRTDSGEGLFIWSSQNVKDLVQLIDVISTLKEGAASKKLCQDASNGPNIDFIELVYRSKVVCIHHLLALV